MSDNLHTPRCVIIDLFIINIFTIKIDRYLVRCILLMK